MVTQSLLAHRRPAGPAVRCVLGVVVAGSLAGLAACGGVTAGSSRTPAAAGSGGQQTSAASQPGAGQQAALCADAAHLHHLVVSVSGPPGPPGHFHAVLPGGLRVSDPVRVRAVASALCGLPAMPHSPLPCPADFGGSYRFSFAAAGRSFPAVTAKATGCQSVSGLGPARMASAAFWALLHKELGGSPHTGGPSGGSVAP
jgi:hypothetical protein